MTIKLSGQFPLQIPGLMVGQPLEYVYIGFCHDFWSSPASFFTSNIHALLETIYDIVDCCFWSAFFLKMSYNFLSSIFFSR